MNSPDTTANDRILTGVLDEWADGIRAHEPERVAAHFTEDAVFQGFDLVRTVGRPGIAAYYDKQPLGLTASYTILERRRISADALVVYADVDFTLPDGIVIPVHLTGVLLNTDGTWLISHYHVSKIGA
jgi:uncharacterized protein (TIGR02246 family)